MIHSEARYSAYSNDGLPGAMPSWMSGQPRGVPVMALAGIQHVALNRDMNLGGAMGQTTPRRPWDWPWDCLMQKVVLFDSEGALLMTPGDTGYYRRQEAEKLSATVLLDNECYATTGGQPVPNADT